MKSLAQSQDVRLSCTIQPQHTKDAIVTDRTKVIQLVSNTVSNAIKFTGTGGVDVRFVLAKSLEEAVKLYTDDASKHAGTALTWGGGNMVTDVNQVLREMETTTPSMPRRNWLYFSVKDTGCGMKQSELAEMFVPYKQARCVC